VASRQHAPHKKRISEWTNPGLIGLGALLLLIGTPMVLWLMTYHSDAAVAMFVITWLSMTVFVLLMAKKSVSDPGYFIDKRMIDKTKQDIATQRRLIRKELLDNEVAALRRGEKSPVLDVWKLDEALSKRHPFFENTTVLQVDPQQKELQTRIELGDFGGLSADRTALRKKVFTSLTSYLGIIRQDAYLGMLKEFFEVYILQIDALREDAQHVDRPFPILSLSMTGSAFWTISSAQKFDDLRLKQLADVRWDDGNEIQPHRFIDSSSPSGMT